MALVDYNRCHPEQCQNGVCLAAQACTRKMLRQEVPFEAPMPDPFMCKGCSDCARACPLKAITIVKN
jgi:translation initiation factor RLI1